MSAVTSGPTQPLINRRRKEPRCSWCPSIIRKYGLLAFTVTTTATCGVLAHVCDQKHDCPEEGKTVAVAAAIIFGVASLFRGAQHITSCCKGEYL